MNFSDLGIKKCSVCGEIKPLDEFGILKRKNVKNPKKTYYRSPCKKCEAEKTQEYYKSHRKERIEYSKNHRNEYNFHARKRYAENPKINEKKKLYKRQNRDKMRVWAKRQYDKNPEKTLAANRKRIKKGIDNLANFYINNRLNYLAGFKGIDRIKMPHDLMELYRKYLKDKRFKKLLKDEKVSSNT